MEMESYDLKGMGNHETGTGGYFASNGLYTSSSRGCSGGCAVCTGRCKG